MIAKLGAVLAAAVLLLLGCQSPPPVPAPGALEKGRAGVLVVPLNVTVRPPRGFDADTEPVWEALIAHLRSSDFEPSALSAATSEVIWEEVLAGLEESAGSVDLRAAWSRFARRVGKGTPNEWVVVPSLLLRRARVTGRQVHWDGVDRDLRVPFALDQRSRADAGPGSDVVFHGYRGVVAAASLHVAVLTTEGQLAWEGVGGLDLVQEIDASESSKRNSWRFQPRREPFEENPHVRAGVALAFERPLPGASRFRELDGPPDEPEGTPPPANAR